MQNWRPGANAQHAARESPQCPARMGWEKALASCRLTADAIDHHGERRPWSSNTLRVCTCRDLLLTCAFPSARRLPAGSGPPTLTDIHQIFTAHGSSCTCVAKSITHATYSRPEIRPWTSQCASECLRKKRAQTTSTSSYLYFRLEKRRAFLRLACFLKSSAGCAPRCGDVQGLRPGESPPAPSSLHGMDSRKARSDPGCDCVRRI